MFPTSEPQLLNTNVIIVLKNKYIFPDSRKQNTPAERLELKEKSHQTFPTESTGLHELDNPLLSPRSIIPRSRHVESPRRVFLTTAPRPAYPRGNETSTYERLKGAQLGRANSRSRHARRLTREA